jgi:hypothetical protein
MRSEQRTTLWQSEAASKHSLRSSSLWNLHPFIQPLSALILAHFLCRWRAIGRVPQQMRLREEMAKIEVFLNDSFQRKI